MPKLGIPIYILNHLIQGWPIGTLKLKKNHMLDLLGSQGVELPSVADPGAIRPQPSIRSVNGILAPLQPPLNFA